MSKLMGVVVDRPTLAQLYGVSEATIALWESQGMPTVAAADPTPAWRPPKKWRVTRVALARYLGLHPDSISRLVASGGLDGALVERGGHGEAMTFDLRRAVRWALEREQPGILNSIAKDDAAAQTFVRLLLESLPETVNEEPPAPAPTPRRKRSPR
jgi:phage terminase Nu1 subunit (DNA packaging protein)